MLRRLGSILGLLLCSLYLTLLTGCSSEIVPEDRPFVSWEDNYLRLQALTFFKTSGRLGIFTPKGRNSAGYDFEGLSGGYLLVIKSPLGNTLASATVTQNSLALNLGDKSYHDEYADALFEQAFGISIPADKLKLILLGIPQGKLEYATSGRIVKAQWDGYKISYFGEVQSGGLIIPKEVLVKNGDYSIRTMVSSFLLKDKQHAL